MQLGERAGLKPGIPLRDAFGEGIRAVVAENPRVVVLDGDLGNSTRTHTIRKAFPERFFNIGIAESNLVGIGAGFAGAGYIPWITSYSAFLLCNAFDQLRLSVAMSNLNAKILGSHGGITLGKDGATQMGIEDLALMGGLPTMTIVVPGDPASMIAAVKAATDFPGPVFLRSSRATLPYIYTEGKCPFTIGKVNVVRPGSDLTICACGLMVPTALDAAAILAEDGIQARVIDFHTIRPLDVETIVAAARETGAIVTAEEHLVHGGMGSNIARVVASYHPVPMRFVGMDDTYACSGEPAALLQKFGMDEEAIVRASRAVLEAKYAA
jgi:transketolase